MVHYTTESICCDERNCVWSRTCRINAENCGQTLTSFSLKSKTSSKYIGKPVKTIYHTQLHAKWPAIIAHTWIDLNICDQGTRDSLKERNVFFEFICFQLLKTLLNWNVKLFTIITNLPDRSKSWKVKITRFKFRQI